MPDLRRVFRRVFRRVAAALGAAAITCGMLSIAFSEYVVLSGQLIVAAVALGLVVFVCIAVSGFTEAYRQVRRERALKDSRKRNRA